MGYILDSLLGTYNQKEFEPQDFASFLGLSICFLIYPQNISILDFFNHILGITLLFLYQCPHSGTFLSIFSSVPTFRDFTDSFLNRPHTSGIYRQFSQPSPRPGELSDSFLNCTHIPKFPHVCAISNSLPVNIFPAPLFLLPELQARRRSCLLPYLP